MKNFLITILLLFSPTLVFGNQSPTASQVATNCSSWNKNLNCTMTNQQLVDNAVDQLMTGGGVSSVSNSDSTITISPTTGAVIVSRPAITGDISIPTSSNAATLATVNSNTGGFGSSTAIPNFTVNGKGLITAAGTNAVIAPAGTLTGTTLASGVVTSSLTTVGTIGTGVWQGTPVAYQYGGTGLNTAPSDDLAVGNGTGWTLKAIGSCSGSTNALSYNTGTHAFGCNTITPGTGTVTNIATTAPIAGGPITTTGTLSCNVASGSQPGCLSSADWTTFNGKQASGNYITALTGGVTASGPGSATATVVTNANLTGPITSVGNATSIASQTGTGTKFVVDTSPTLVTPTLGVATATSINKVTITAPATSATLTIADGKTLTATNTVNINTLTDGKMCTYTAAGTVLNCNTTIPTGTVTGSGTTNFVPKWASSTGLSNSQLFDNGTSVGINTSTPSSISGYKILSINSSGAGGGLLDFQTTGTSHGYIYNSGVGMNIDNLDNSHTYFHINSGTVADFTSTGSNLNGGIFSVGSATNYGSGIQVAQPGPALLRMIQTDATTHDGIWSFDAEGNNFYFGTSGQNYFQVVRDGGGIEQMNLMFGIVDSYQTMQVSPYTVGIKMPGGISPVSTLDVAGNVTLGADYAGVYAAPTNGMLMEGNLALGDLNGSFPLSILNDNFPQFNVASISDSPSGFTLETAGSGTPPTWGIYMYGTQPTNGNRFCIGQLGVSEPFCFTSGGSGGMIIGTGWTGLYVPPADGILVKGHAVFGGGTDNGYQLEDDGTALITGATSLSNKIINYNNITTVSNGVPSELGTVDLATQSAAISATTAYTPTATGLYRVSIYLQVTRAATTSSILGGATGAVITYNDGDGNVAQSDTVALASTAGTIVTTSATNTTGTNLTGTMVIYAKTGVAIKYAIGYTSVGTTSMQYAAHLKVEAL